MYAVMNAVFITDEDIAKKKKSLFIWLVVSSCQLSEWFM